jgi:hypothetical protein
MSQKLPAVQKTFLTVALVSAFCLTLLISNNSITGRSSAQENRPQIINLTEGFKPSSLTEKDGKYVMLLENNYSKNINGYVIGIGKSGKVAVDLTIGSRAITPGGVAEEHIPISNLRAPTDLRASTEEGAPTPGITILAVLFEDGTSEGAAPVIAEIKERRAGTKIQLKRILSLLQSSPTSARTAKLIALGELKGQIASLSEGTQDAMSLHAKRGFRGAKEDILTRLETLEQSDTELTEGLTRLKGDIEKRIARL